MEYLLTLRQVYGSHDWEVQRHGTMADRRSSHRDCSRPGGRALGLDLPTLARVDHHGRSQADRHHVRADGHGVSGHRRLRSPADATATVDAERGPDRAGRLQPVVHHARHDDGVLRGHADPDRHGQLPGAADDRGPRHGLSAAQRAGLLGHVVWRTAGVLQFCHGRRAGLGLVCLRSADRDHVRPQRGHRLLGAWA